MRIRSIKPEFWRSDDIDALDWHTRLVFVGLWSYVDDNGVGVYKLSNIVSDLFAYDFYTDPTETLSRVSEALKQLEMRSMIDLYKVDGRDWLYITNWEQHQRVNNPNKARYPAPTSGNTEPTEELHRSDAGSGETLPPGAGEQGSSGTGEQGKELAHPGGASDTAFDEFWSAYPRKVSKGDALKAFRQAVKRADADTIVAGARRLAADPNLPEPKYIPYPGKWLRGDQWEDEPMPQQVSTKRDNTIDAWGTPTGQTATDFIDGEVVEFRRALP